MKHSVKKFIRFAKVNGLREAAAVSLKRLSGTKTNDPFAQGTSSPTLSSILTPSKQDVIGFYGDIFGYDHGNAEDLAAVNPDKNTIQWVIPNFGYGSGGHLNIFRFINALAARGMKQNVVILPPYSWKSAEVAKETIKEWYFELDAEVSLGVEGFKPSYYTFATGWQTAYWVSKHQASHEKFYFVQDFEPNFYPVSSEYYFAEKTYELGLKGITAGTWLQKKLSKDYGMKCGSVSFSFDRDMYKPLPKKGSPNFNILFYSRHVTKRRLFELGLCALEKVCAKHPEVAVIFAGGDVGGFEVPFHHLNAGELSLAELPELYSQCDLVLVLSGTNLSLLPLEVAACKCPLVMNDTPSARWLLPDTAAYYAGMSPDEMADTICQAINDDEGRLKKTEAAYKLAQKSSWDKEVDKFVKLLDQLTK
jgi:glycosyltransferase involved in cell wall biosynthesis